MLNACSSSAEGVDVNSTGNNFNFWYNVIDFSIDKSANSKELFEIDDELYGLA